MRRAIAALALLALAGAALAQGYPAKPVKIVVGFAAGGPTDVIARILAADISVATGQSFFVENRPGANAIIATEAVAHAPADGYTTLFSSLSLLVNPILPGTQAKYDPFKDFAPVSNVAALPMVVVAAPGAPFNSMKELIDLARSKPGSLNFSSPGVGSANHLAGELFTSLSGIQAVHVPYKGIPEAMYAVMSDSIQFSFLPVTNVVPLTHDGKLLALATSTGRRVASLPGLPTVAEAGVPGYRFDPWYGMLAPARTPRALLDRLSREVARIVELPDFREQMRALGAEPAPTTPEEFDALVRSEVAKFGRIVREARIHPE